MVRSSRVVCCLGMMGVAALGWLPACSGQGGEGTGGDGGSGAEGGGGSGMITTGGDGGGGGTGDADCSPACDEDSACVDGECVPVRVASFSAVRLQILNGADSLGELGEVNVCEREAGAPPSFEVIAEEGGCKALVPAAPDGPGASIGISQVTVYSPSVGYITMTKGGAAGCLGSPVDINAEYLDSEVVSFDASHGTHNPAFQITAESPPAFTMSAGPITAGQPYEVTWETEGDPPFFGVLPDDGSVRIECTPTAGTSMVIPASLIDLLDPIDPGVLVIGYVQGAESTLEVSPAYRARASALRIEYHQVPLQAAP